MVLAHGPRSPCCVSQGHHAQPVHVVLLNEKQWNPTTPGRGLVGRPIWPTWAWIGLRVGPTARSQLLDTSPIGLPGDRVLQVLPYLALPGPPLPYQRCFPDREDRAGPTWAYPVAVGEALCQGSSVGDAVRRVETPLNG